MRSLDYRTVRFSLSSALVGNEYCLACGGNAVLDTITHRLEHKAVIGAPIVVVSEHWIWWIQRTKVRNYPPLLQENFDESPYQLQRSNVVLTYHDEPAIRLEY